MVVDETMAQVGYTTERDGDEDPSDLEEATTKKGQTLDIFLVSLTVDDNG